MEDWGRERKQKGKKTRKNGGRNLDSLQRCTMPAIGYREDTKEESTEHQRINKCMHIHEMTGRVSEHYL
jgi:hypothetical protein